MQGQQQKRVRGRVKWQGRRKNDVGEAAVFHKRCLLPTTPAALKPNLENLGKMEAMYFDISMSCL